MVLLYSSYFGYIDNWINESTSAENGHINVILDPHNYARFWGKILGSEEPTATFVDLWRKLANKYKSNPYVIFDLMNEPHDLPIDDWYTAAQAAIDAIREEGAENLSEYLSRSAFVRETCTDPIVSSSFGSWYLLDWCPLLGQIRQRRQSRHHHRPPRQLRL